jgi:uroporphyrinogen decarboxylase
MKSRERILAALLGKKTDRHPYLGGMGWWAETVERWKSESGRPDLNMHEYFGFDDDIWYIGDGNEIRFGINPWFEHIVLEEKERTVIYRDGYGIVAEGSKVGATIPNYIEYPVKDRESWEKFKEERLNFENPPRIPENIKELGEKLNTAGAFISLGCYPYGLFGTCRDFMGAEGLLIAFIEEPELVADIMNHLTDLWLSVYSKAVKYIKFDMLHMWEDMSGKQGSLISPQMVSDFMLPNYRRISQFCKDNGIEVFSVDTDGNCEELVPLFMSAGVNFIFPFEVAAGCDILEYRKQYPELAIMGGIDKREIAKGKKEIDKQIATAAEMLSRGRYIAALDHHVHPEVSWDNFCYYMKCLKEITHNL